MHVAHAWSQGAALVSCMHVVSDSKSTNRQSFRLSDSGIHFYIRHPSKAFTKYVCVPPAVYTFCTHVAVS